MDSRQKQDLDRHITGNYGEDQFKGQPERCFTCKSCQNYAKQKAAYEAAISEAQGMPVAEDLQVEWNSIKDTEFICEGNEE